jgi:hypothetical protein
MTRLARWIACVVLVVTSWSSVSGADSRTDFLIGRLKAEDFRVRTNAALALGQTGDETAVNPLCAALDDGSDVVRQAAAVALGRLAKPMALGCLKDRLAVEAVDGVKRQILKALDALQPAAQDPSSPSAPRGGSAPRVVANAKYYVALSSVSNQTGRADAEVGRLIDDAVRGKLGELGEFQLAPDHEGPEQARAAMAKRKLKGFYLSIRVEAFDYSGGNLRVRVKIAVFTYPGKDLRGEVPAGLTQTGVRPGDKTAEDTLMQMAAGRAVELFAQNFQ